MKFIYWMGYLGLMFAGTLLVQQRLLPVENTTIFLLGLLWIWNGVLSLLGQNAVFKLNPPKFDRAFAFSILAMGVVWVLASLTPLSNQGMFMFGISSPFFLLIAAAKNRFKN